MKVRSVEDLSQRLDEELAWRKFEIAEMGQLIAQAGRSNQSQKALLRGALAMLYAHFEGFVREAVYLYLCYVATGRRPISALRSELLGFPFSPILRGRGMSLDEWVEFVGSVRGELNEKRFVAKREDTNAGGNLNYQRLCSILVRTGISIQFLDGLEGVIDESLLARRNEIAHGQANYVDQVEFHVTRDKILGVMDSVSGELLSAAAGRLFLK